MMRYISDDGKVFHTEKECREYEQKVGQERIKKEELKKKQKERYHNICKHHKELMNEINAYENDYKSHVFSKYYYDGLTQFISELSRLLC